MIINVKFHKDNAAEDEKPVVKSFPDTEFAINVLKRELNWNNYDKIVDVEIDFFPTYKVKHDWEFKEEIRQMFFDKSVDEIQKIVEQVGVVTYVKMLDVLEEKMYVAKQKETGEKYEDIIQGLIRKIYEKDERGYLIPEELL